MPAMAGPGAGPTRADGADLGRAEPVLDCCGLCILAGGPSEWSPYPACRSAACLARIYTAELGSEASATSNTATHGVRA